MTSVSQLAAKKQDTLDLNKLKARPEMDATFG